MELSHTNTTDPIFRAIVVIVAVVQTLTALGFMVAGDFGKPLAFSMSWLLSAAVLLAAAFMSENRLLLFACIGFNSIGLIFLWTGYTFFPNWLYGNILTSYGAHTVFVACASFVNVLPIVVCLIYRLKLQQSNPP